VGNTVFLGITTPQDDNNPFDELMRKQVDSIDVFNQIRYENGLEKHFNTI